MTHAVFHTLAHLLPTMVYIPATLNLKKSSRFRPSSLDSDDKESFFFECIMFPHFTIQSVEILKSLQELIFFFKIFEMKET